MTPEYVPRETKKALEHIIEECGEVLAAAGKTLRFGPECVDPNAEIPEPNLDWLLRELNDLDFAIKNFKVLLHHEGF